MTGNSPAAYPEAFRNCADFKIAEGTITPTPAASPTATPPTEAPTAPPTETPTPPEPTTTPSVLTPAPAVVPTPEAPTAAPVSPTPGGSCTAVLGNNNGCTDESCAQCAAGHQWWPCNLDPPCCDCAAVQPQPPATTAAPPAPPVPT